MQITDAIIKLLTATELTLSSDAITITQGNHKLQPQTGTTDNLSTINGTTQGQFGILYVSDFGTDTITIKHNVGNILCVGGTDIALSNGCVFWYSNGTKVFISGAGGSSGLTDGDKGDITVSGSGATWTIDNDVVTLAKMANMATASFLGRNTAATGDPEVLSIATVKTMLSFATGAMVGTTDTQTLTNKRITRREGTVASSATPTINTDNVDAFTITALAVAITSMTTNLSGTPTSGQELEIEILDNGTARAITWGASFASGPATLPTTTVLSKWLYAKFRYSSSRSKWICMATGNEQ